MNRQSKMRVVVKRLASRGLRTCHIDLAGRYAFTTADGCRFWLHDEVESHSLWIDSQDSGADHLSSFFRAYLHEGAVVVDIGSNIGRYAILGSRLVGMTGEVYAFEPTRSVFRELEQNLQLNSCQNVRPFRLAVAERSGRVELWEYDSSVLNGMFARSERPPRSITSCEAISGVEVMNLIPQKHIDLLKIDVEGAELQVLRGFGETLKRIDCIVFECSRANARRAGCSTRDLLLHLADRCDLYEWRVPDIGLEAIQAQSYDTVNRDLVAVPRNGDSRVRTLLIAGREMGAGEIAGMGAG